MIIETDFLSALKIAHKVRVLFRQEYASDWICANREDGAVIYTNVYGVPVYIGDKETPVALEASILSNTRLEFHTNKKLEIVVKKLLLDEKLSVKDVESNKEKNEEFPSPVRLCTLSAGDYFKVASEPNGNLYSKGAYMYEDEQRCSCLSVHPDNECYYFDKWTSVYKCNKDGEIIAAS